MADPGEKLQRKMSGAERRRAKKEGVVVDGSRSHAQKKSSEEPQLKAGINHLISPRTGVDWCEGVLADEYGRPTQRQDFATGANMVERLMDSKLAKKGDKNFCIRDRDDAVELCGRMMAAGFFHQINCKVVNSRNLLTTASRNEEFGDSDADCYVITYEGSKTLRYVVGGCILLVMFGMFSFPAWPDTPKIYVRDGSRVVLVGMLGTLVPITVLRPIVAGLTGWWFLPNLWESEEFFESFRPTWQAPVRRRDGQSDAVWTVIITVIVFSGLYWAYQTEVIDPDADDPGLDQDQVESKIDDLLDQEDVFDPEAVEREEEARAAAADGEEPDEAVPDSAADDDAPPVEAWCARPRDPLDFSVETPPYVGACGRDDEEEEDDELMKEFLEEAQAEQRKLDRKASKHLREERKPVHGGS